MSGVSVEEPQEEEGGAVEAYRRASRLAGAGLEDVDADARLDESKQGRVDADGRAVAVCGEESTRAASAGARRGEVRAQLGRLTSAAEQVGREVEVDQGALCAS